MTVELHMLPVQAGDATLIIDRSQERPYTVLIDAGLAKDEVVSYLQSIGVYHLDLIILSHPDLDHLQGLLAILSNPLISLGQVWCFDLAFLREFVRTGKIPRPKDSTREIIYTCLLRTLDGMDKVLKTLSERNVLTLQVSAGHRLTLGSLYIEVLYPWDGFYNALHSPMMIRELLAKKWPADWTIPEWLREDTENQRSASAQKITRSEEQVLLGNLMDGLNSEEQESAPQPLAATEVSDNLITDKEGMLSNQKDLPISLLGTLYNNLSIVTKIHVLGGINPATMLFPGDLTDWTYLIARRLFDLSADIFKYPHHGSTRSDVDRKALRYFGSPSFRCCPCGPWCHPKCCEWHHDYWDRLEKGIAAKDGYWLLAEVVNPSHVLVYPYPSQRLPNPNFIAPFTGQIHANRQNMGTANLNDRTNKAVSHILKIGKEKNEIKVV